MISFRLKTIANMVTKDMIVADIGCDHAFLPVYLVENGICQKVYASDNKEGPLAQAKKTIREAGLQNQIIPVLSNGLDDLESDVNCLAIAGMGAELIIDILNAHLDNVRNMQEIIVQANTSVYKLRQFLSDNSFLIIDEKIVKEFGKYYEIIKFIPHSGKKLTDEDIWLGPLLKDSCNPIYKDYLLKRYQTMLYIAEKNNSIVETQEYKILKNKAKDL